MMECARGEPIGVRGLSGPRLLSASPRVGQNRCATTACRSQQSAGESSTDLHSRSGGGHLPEVDIVLPDGPDDAGQLVGKGDGGLVVTAQAMDLQGPGTQAVGIAPRLGLPEDGAGAVSEKHAEVDVAALADGPEAADET